MATSQVVFAVRAPTKPLAERVDMAKTVFVGKLGNKVMNGDWVHAELLIENPLMSSKRGEKTKAFINARQTQKSKHFHTAAAKESVTQDGSMAASEAIPASARFDLKDIKNDRCSLVGRLSMKRKFMGTRATPAYHDVVQFHCFNGDELKFSTFTDPGLESRLSKRLANGRSLPVVMTVRFERIRVGHDGINMSERLVAHIEACKPTTAKAICSAAEAADFDTAKSVRYKAALEPDVIKGGIAVSLGKVSVQSKVTPRGSALAIHGIRVFNPTSKVVTIEIVGLSIEQEGVSQRCVLNKRTRAPKRWQVEAGGWSDGSYEKGKMPGVLWMFDRSGPIKPEKKVKVQLKLKLNGSDPITLTRTVDPI